MLSVIHISSCTIRCASPRQCLKIHISIHIASTDKNAYCHPHYEMCHSAASYRNVHCSVDMHLDADPMHVSSLLEWSNGVYVYVFFFNSISCIPYAKHAFFFSRTHNLFLKNGKSHEQYPLEKTPCLGLAGGGRTVALPPLNISGHHLQGDAQPR